MDSEKTPEMVPGVTPAAGTHSPQQAAAEAPVSSERPAAPSHSDDTPPGPGSPGVMSPQITIDDFMKIDLRAAKVLAAERVPKSKKLIKLTLDLGYEQRTLAAGIAEAYEPESLVGQHVVIVANLAPRTLLGIESNGMVLAASVEGGQPVLVSFETPLPPGARVR